MPDRNIYVAIPLLDELDQLPRLLKCLEDQDCKDFLVIFCINQPDDWWDDPQNEKICRNNSETIRTIEGKNDPRYRIIDRSSRGRGWKGKKHGVGMARKVLMDAIEQIAGADDILISLDGDTSFGSHYFSSIRNNLDKNKECLALSVPYYHELTGSEKADRAVMRYEIYMRHYLLNLLQIGSPYSFTALGSAIAFRIGAYRKIGGMTPVLSGEDFYFLQKMAKAGAVGIWNGEKVYPAARFSSRVYFGTGPAMIKGNLGDWSSYPVYHHSLFSRVKHTYDLFPSLYLEDFQTPMDDFLGQMFAGKNIWQPLRDNVSNLKSFIKACHQKVDGLRVLQFLKESQKNSGYSDEQSMEDFLTEYYPEVWRGLDLPDGFTFDGLSIEKLSVIREAYTALTDEKCLQVKKTGVGQA